jgi:isopentenyl-diphosphate delta-isomerase
MAIKEVILVDEQDRQSGTMEKLAAHKQGLLHRAFSIFIFNSNGKMLLQRRALKKYHSGGLWTNACCSHPEPGEGLDQATTRRLKEEMGFETSVEKLFDFIYKTSFENGLIEYEFDHVFAGEYDGAITPDSEEAMDYCYKSVPEISQSLQAQPHLYSAWFKAAFPRIEGWWISRYSHLKNNES